MKNDIKNAFKTPIMKGLESLAMGNSLFNRLIEACGLGLVLLDKNGIILSISETASKMLCEAPEKLLMEPFGRVPLQGEAFEFCVCKEGERCCRVLEIKAMSGAETAGEETFLILADISARKSFSEGKNRREALSKGLMKAISILSEEWDFETTSLECLLLLREVLGCRRVLLFENYIDPNLGFSARQTIEVTDSYLGPSAGRGQPVVIVYDEKLEPLYKALSSNEILFVSLGEEGNFSRLLLEGFSSLSMALAPVRAMGNWRGFIALESGCESKVWDEESVEFTKYISIIVGDRMKTEISKQRLTEAENMLNEAQRIEGLGRLASGVAHGFNNMLNGISAYVELLSDEVEGEEKKRYIEEIHKTISRGKTLTNNILSYAQKDQTFTRNLNCNTELTGLKRFLEAALPKNISMLLMISENLPDIYADRNQFIQSAMNICLNSIEAMPEGGTLSLETFIVEGGEEPRFIEGRVHKGRYVAVRITDDGRGMDDETLKKAFTPFFTTRPMGDALGLGLPIVKRFVEASDGYVDIQSKPGAGTSVTLYFPAVEGVNGNSYNEFVPASGKNQGVHTILVVDDEDIVRVPLASFLEDVGYEVIQANNGEDAISKFKSSDKKIDLVIIDLAMPIMDGLEAMRHITGIDPRVPFIVASGYNMESVAQKAPAGAVIEFLQKPFELKSLEDLLAKFNPQK